MDFALERFKKIDFNGIIVGLDADTLVEPNYFIEINAFLSKAIVKQLHCIMNTPLMVLSLVNFIISKFLAMSFI